jgi:aryl-alcohol dehydrogenase-like predicted oxidoreductase
MLLSIAGRPPEEQARATLHAALDAGINFIDTAGAYCLDESEYHHNERLIASVLRLRGSPATVATKVGVLRPGGAWTVDGRPSTIRAAALASLEALGVQALDLLQLHAPDSRVPFADTVGALARLREEGKVKLIGLCNVSWQQLVAARRIVPIATVQNRWNVEDRRAEADGMLDHCAREGIAFLAYSPFGGARGAPVLGTHGRLAEQARRRRVSPHRLMLSWMLAKNPAVIPLVGARRPESIADSARAPSLELTAEDVAALDDALVVKPVA